MKRASVTSEERDYYGNIRDTFPGDKNVKDETRADVRCAHPDHPDRNPSLGVDLVKDDKGTLLAPLGDRSVVPFLGPGGRLVAEEPSVTQLRVLFGG
jgi:hypothetical protein